MLFVNFKTNMEMKGSATAYLDSMMSSAQDISGCRIGSFITCKVSVVTDILVSSI